MIETLAHKRTHLAALAVLAGLVVALFAVMQSVSAVDGTVSVEIGETSDIEVHSDYTAAASANEAVATVLAPDSNEVVVTGVAAGTTTVTISEPDDRDDATTERDDLVYEVTVVPFGFKSITSDDSDNTVKAGTRVTVTAVLQSEGTAGQIRLVVPTTGLSIQPATGDNTSQSETKTVTGDGTDTASFVINTAGAPEQAYTLTFIADRNTFATDDVAPFNAVTDTSFTLTVGDPGDGLASASLGPNNVDSAGSPSKTGSPDKTSKAKGSTIQLVVKASNSLGEDSNPGDVDQVIVFAVGGSIGNNADADVAQANSRTFAEDPDTAGDEVGATQAFSVTRAKAGKVIVKATIVGPANDVQTNEIELVFTGDAEDISLGAPSDVLGQGGPGTEGDSITVEVTATDDADNTASINPLQTTSVKITDADGNTARNITHTEAQKQDNKGTPDDASDDEDIATAVVITISTGTAAKAEAGTYTLEVKLGSKDTETVEFVVTGAAANVALEVDNRAPGDDDNFVTATATVTDKDGNPVVDDTPVTFSASGNNAILDLIEVTDGHKTKDGMAKADFFVVGAGRSLIGATSGTGRDAVAVISTAGAPDDAADDEPSLSDFANNGAPGTTSWLGPDATASELLALLAGRANAIWLNNGDAWVLYAMTGDGAMVPGSVNFSVTAGSVVYISP